jgi:hypothetical protein
MTIRFLHSVPSGHPDAPFLPGAVVYLERCTPEVFRWLRTGKAEVVRESVDEYATLVPRETRTACQ